MGWSAYLIVFGFCRTGFDSDFFLLSFVPCGLGFSPCGLGFSSRGWRCAGFGLRVGRIFGDGVDVPLSRWFGRFGLFSLRRAGSFFAFGELFFEAVGTCGVEPQA